MRTLCCTLLLLLLGHFSYAQDVLAGEEMGLVEDSSRAVPATNAIVLVDKAPKPLNMPELKNYIKYPKEARKRNITGKVMVRVLVDTSGIPIKHEILRSPDPILTEAALKGITISDSPLQSKTVSPSNSGRLCRLILT